MGEGLADPLGVFGPLGARVNRGLRLALRVLRQVGAGDIGPALAVDARAAVELLDGDRKHRRKVRLEKSLPRRQGEAEDDRATKARRARIRVKVLARSAGACQVCLGLVEHHQVASATDMHHVLGGPDRQVKERVDTCLGLCALHHDESSKVSLHAGHLPSLEAAHRYCLQHRMHEAAAALARRIEKVHEARRFAPQQPREESTP